MAHAQTIQNPTVPSACSGLDPTVESTADAAAEPPADPAVVSKSERSQVDGLVEPSVAAVSPVNVVLADRLGARFTRQTVFQAFLACWFVPAAVQFVVGASSVLGLPVVGSDAAAQRLDLVWAAVVVLSLPTILVGAMWAIRSWDSLPVRDEVTSRWAHGVALSLCVACVPLVPMMKSLAPSQLPFVLLFMAACGFVVGLYPARWLLGFGSVEADVLAAFLVVVTFQLSLGWFHLSTWGLAPSFLLACEGMALAVTSLSAAKAVSTMTAEARSAVVAGVSEVDGADVADVADVADAMSPVGSITPAG